MFYALPTKPSAVDQCAETIRDAILSGELSAGTRLPAERNLAERFGVHRGTLRGALARLAEERLLNVRQGSGYVVQDFRLRGGPRLLPGLAGLAEARGELAQVADDLLTMRRALARAVLEKVAGRSESLDVPPVLAAIARFSEVAAEGGDVEAVAEADMAVMAAILEATDSAVMRLCLNPLVEVVAGLPRLRAAVFADPMASVRAYEVLVAWLRAPQTAPPGALDAILGAMARRDDETVARLAREEDR